MSSIITRSQKAKGRFLFRGNRPCFPIFRRPGTAPGSQLIATSENLVLASRARIFHPFCHHIRCMRFLGSIPKQSVSRVLRKSRCRFSRWPLSTLSYWKISLPLIRKILAICLKVIGSYTNIFVENCTCIVEMQPLFYEAQ